MKDSKILLRGIEFYAYGGVTVEEKKVGQRYSVDADLMLDLARAASTDDLLDTVSYADAVGIVLHTARVTPFNLLESLATRMAEALLEAMPLDTVTVQLYKLLPPIEATIASAGVQVTLEGSSRRG